MYKMLMFLKKSDDKNVINHFKKFTIPILNQLTCEKIEIAMVESSLLLEQKYTLYSEIGIRSKDEWDKLMATKEGKKLNKDLVDLHQYIDIIFVNYNEEL